MKLIDPFNKAVFHLDRVSDYLKGKTVWPVSMEVDLSDNCNLGCSWCRFAQGHKPSMMPLELAKKIQEQLWNRGVKSIVYSGGGEPTMNPDFNRILVHGRLLELDQGVYTNGTNLEEPSHILDQTTKFVYVSIDAATPKTYEEIKKRDMFKKVIRETHNFCRTKRRTKVGIGFLVSPQNIHEIERAADDLLLLTRADYLQFRPAVGTLTLEQTEEAYERAKAVAAKEPGGEIIVADYKFEDLISHLKGEPRPYQRCHAHNFLGGISADGSVWFCLNHRYEEGFKIGDMTESNFGQIWLSKERMEIARNLDVQKCPILCRPHELNKFLHILTCAQNDHMNFL